MDKVKEALERVGRSDRSRGLEEDDLDVLASEIFHLRGRIEILTDKYSQNAPKNVEEALAAANTTWAEGTWAKQCARVLANEVLRQRDELEFLHDEVLNLESDLYEAQNE